MPFTTDVVGVYGGAQFTGSDYTDPAVTQPFMNFYADLFAIANSGSAPDAAKAATLQADLIKLLNIAKNGISIQPENAGGKSVTYYMTAQMADSLNEVLKHLQAGGLTDLPNVSVEGLGTWYTNVRADTHASGLPFNQGLFNLFYYVANYFSSSKVSLDPTTQAAELTAALAKTSGNVAISAYAGRSLQAMTEVDYVNEGNKLINETLTAMYEAMGITKDIIDSMATLQGLHNGIKVVSRQDNITYARGDITPAQFKEKYERTMSSFSNNLIPQLSEEYSPWLFPGAEITYGQIESNPNNTGAGVTKVTIVIKLPADTYTIINPLTQEMTTRTQSVEIAGRYILPIPSSEFVDPPTPEFLTKLANYMAYQMPSEVEGFTNSATFGLPYLTATPGSVWPLITKASDLVEVRDDLVAAKAALLDQIGRLSASAPPSAFTNPQSLYNLAKKVYDDMGDVTTIAGARAWMMDNYQSLNTPDATKAGALQQGITSAITAAQSTNDEQKEKVRNNLFLFEEFYKSASTVLTQLNQIMVKMAQNISR